MKASEGLTVTDQDSRHGSAIGEQQVDLLLGKLRHGAETVCLPQRLFIVRKVRACGATLLPRLGRPCLQRGKINSSLNRGDSKIPPFL